MVPFNKGSDILARTIASLTKQTYSRDRFEVILVADNNYEDAKFVSEQFKRELDVKLLTISNDGFGAASSRNVEIGVAKGDVIVSLDSDMICPSTFLESHMGWFHKSAKIATIGIRKFVNVTGIQPRDVIRNFHYDSCIVLKVKFILG